MKTIFISFDGLDGSGKSWAVEKLAARLRADGLRVWVGKLRPLVGTSRCESATKVENFCARLRQVMTDLARDHDVVILDRAMVTFIALWTFWKGVMSPEAVWQIFGAESFPALNVVLTPPLGVCRDRLRQKGEDSFAQNDDGEDCLLSIDRTTRQTVEFLKPRLGNRLAVFKNNEVAVEWAYQMVQRLRTHFDLHLTNACPLKCPTCCFGAGEGAKVAQAIDGRWREIVDAGLAAGIDEFHLMGGEPLILGQHLVELMRYIRERGGKIHLLTSGYDLTYADEVLPLCDAVFVSLDGPRETHNRTRGRNIFDNACEFIRRAARHGCKIRIGTVVSRLNIATAHQVVDVVAGLMAEVRAVPRSLCFINMSPTGGLFSQTHSGQAISSAALDNYLMSDEWLGFVERLKRDQRVRSLPWVKVEPAFSKRAEDFGCELLQGKRRVMVMSDGSMYLCPMLTPLPSESNILDGDPVAALVKLLSWSPSGADPCGNGCQGGCLGYAKLFGQAVCDARCGKPCVASRLPEKFRLSEERIRQGYRPICPCRTVRVKDW